METARAINSMFAWYRSAALCLVYLDDVEHGAGGGRDAFRRRDRPELVSEWFERRWTLQELLAPGEGMEFYDRAWKRMGSKAELVRELEGVTGIEGKYLTADADLCEASVATRISWMAGRFTTEVEDVAYSMLGLFDVNMEIHYGEGVKAFMGLQRALMQESRDESLFAWTLPRQGRLRCHRSSKPAQRWQGWAEKEWGVLAPSPDCFEGSGDVVMPPPDNIVHRLGGGYVWTQQGVQFQMPLKSGTEATNMFGLIRKEITLALNCWKLAGDGTPETVRLKLVKRQDGYRRVELDRLDLKKGAKPSTDSVLGIDQAITRPLTITQLVFRL